MKHAASTVLACILAVYIPFSSSRGEILYLKDGRVIWGDIVGEGKDGVTISSNGKQSVIAHDEIRRIMYGAHEPEQVYLFTVDRELIRGYVVDHDEKKIVYRQDPVSPEEKTILRDNILEISQNEIRPQDLEVYLKPAMFYPLDSGGAALKSAPMYLAGIAFSSLVRRDVRLALEFGYAESESAEHSGQAFRYIPITLSAMYPYRFYMFELIPRAGTGIGIVRFKSGEGEDLRGTALELHAGAGVLYKIRPRDLLAGVWLDYNLLFDGKNVLNSFIVGLSVNYRL